MALAAAAIALSSPTLALESYSFKTPGAPDELRQVLRGASLLDEARKARPATAQDLYAAARADYARLLGALYAEGYYSGIIHIWLDGREAADIAPLDAPSSISSVVVSIEPGPPFRFSRARMRPYARGTELPPEYRDRQPAYSTAIEAAAVAGIEGWRQKGHAKAEVASQSVVADHGTATVDSLIELQPGPRLRFGQLRIAGQDRMRAARIAQIAGLPAGAVFDPDDLQQVADRLRRTGVFRSVALTEAETPSRDGTLDIDLVVVEEKPRRIGFGAELSSFDGLTLSGYWLHRNLLGGGERLRFDARISGIGGQSGGEDYSVGVRLDRPATFTPDTSAFVEAKAQKLIEDDYTSEGFNFGFGLSHRFSDSLTAEAGLSFEQSTVTDAAGSDLYRLMALPVSVTWDRRDSSLSATRGFYAAATAKPFLGQEAAGSGARLTSDMRVYRGFGNADRPFVLAGRIQAGTILGTTLLGAPRDYLFYSGGGGTVRGQPYQSLGVLVARSATLRTGGLSFVAISGEARLPVSPRISVVAFYDAGYVDAFDLFGGLGSWHSGAGLGVRYDTGIGPIRLDVGLPVSGTTGDGPQIYIGIGQSF